MAVTGITVHPAKEFTDQRYQLTVEITPLDGRSATTTTTLTPASPTDAAAGKMAGVWKRFGNGKLLETLEVRRDGQGWRVAQSEPGGKPNIFRITPLTGGWLELAPPFAPQYDPRIRLDTNGRLVWETYHAADQRNWWTGSYDRAGPAAGAASPAAGSAASPTAGAAAESAAGTAPLRNLALHRPARQSSTYSGTGVDRGGSRHRRADQRARSA